MTVFQNRLSPDFSEGVDRKLLKQVRDRFLKVNADRLNKTYEGLSPRHQDILLVLPLLYHVNHPLMPGFVSRLAPMGVSAYEPDKSTLSIAKSFSQTFKFQKDKRHKDRIHAIYMMGSTGTLAHSEASDVDLWLCHDPMISLEQKKLLTEKAFKIDEWANSLGLELHTFLMDADAFRQGATTNEMDKESSGSAQHYLLLDEFYRTAILLAGRYPLWWLIPPDFEDQYISLTENLLTKRFIKETEVLDFGSAADIPKNELIGAGLWQLYKGLDSPYKSVLKILLAEVYAQELPLKYTLSQTFKQAVYDDELAVESLDPYLLIYRRLEAYLLERKEHKRLDLVRKSFYLKVAKKLSKRPTGRKSSWQRVTLEKVVKNWAWSDDKFVYLDSRSQWKVDQVMQERQVVMAELGFCYRFLSQYARANRITSSITADDLNLLGRKLYATFQRKAGKVERVNPGIAGNLWEENLALHHGSSQPLQTNQHNWLLYRDLSIASDASFQPTLKKSTHLIELLAWLYFNEMITHETRLSLVPGDSDVRVFELQQMVRALEQSTPLPFPPVLQELFKKPAYMERIVLFINVGVDPMKNMSEKGMHRISDKNDSLDYSSERNNLVKTIDQIALNSWHEVMAHRFEMGETLMQNLQYYLQVCQSQLDGPTCELDIYCFCVQRANAIAKRVEDLFHGVKSAFFVDVGSFKKIIPVRYVLEVEERFYVLQYVDAQFRYFSYVSEQALYSVLEQPQRQYSTIIFDAYSQQEEFFLKEVLKNNLPNLIQIFYHIRGDVFQVVVLDEVGSLLRFILPITEEEIFQYSISQCIDRVLETRQLSESLSDDVGDIDFKLYKVTKSGNAQYRVRPVSQIKPLEVNEIQVHGFRDGLAINVDIAFSGTEFTFSEYGEQQFQALVHFVRSQKEFNNRLPLAVTELMLVHNSLDPFLENKIGTIDCLKVYAQAEQSLEIARQKHLSE